MASCSATAARSSIWPVGRRSATTVTSLASTARRITPGRHRSPVARWSCCVRASSGDRGCPTSCLRRRGTHRQLRAGASRPRAGRRARRAGAPEVWRHRMWRVLRRPGLNTRAKRLSVIAGYRASYELPAGPSSSATPTRHSRGPSWSSVPTATRPPSRPASSPAGSPTCATTASAGRSRMEAAAWARHHLAFSTVGFGSTAHPEGDARRGRHPLAAH